MTSIRSLAVAATAAASLVAVRPTAPPTAVCQQARSNAARTATFGPDLAITGAGTLDEPRHGVRHVWTGTDCIAWIIVRPGVLVTEDESDVIVAGDAEFIAYDEGRRGKREYHVAANGARTFTRDGAPAAETSGDSLWVREMIRELVRRSGYRAAERARSIALHGGLDSLFAEADHIAHDHVRATYLLAGFPLVSDSAGRSSFIARAGALLDEPDAKTGLLLSAPAAWRSDIAVIDAVYRAAVTIEPDGDVEQVLRAFPPPRPLPARLTEPLRSLIATLSTRERRAEVTARLIP